MDFEDYVKAYAKKHKISILKATQLLKRTNSFQRNYPPNRNEFYLKNDRGLLRVYKGYKVVPNSNIREVSKGHYYMYVNGKLLRQGTDPLLLSYPTDMKSDLPEPNLEWMEGMEGYERPVERPQERPTSAKRLSQEKQIANELLQAYQQLEGRPNQSPMKKQESKKVTADKLLNAYYNLSSNPATVESADMQNLMQAIQRSYFNLSSSPSTKRRLDEGIQTITQTASPETQDQLIYELQQSYFNPSISPST
jgi:hypothetical protein